MKGFLLTTVAVIGITVAASGVAFVGQYMDLWSTGFFQPRYEQIRNKTFHESQSYNDGMIRDLEDIKMQYLQATPEQRSALRAIALHRFSVYPENKLPADLQVFYDMIQSPVQ